MKLSPDLLLRAALAFAFIYPAIDAVIEPDSWVTFFPPFLLAIVPSMLLIYGWSFIEILLAVWILSGRRIILPCALAAAALVAIVLFNLPLFQIVFRDLSLAGLALALALNERTRAKD